MDYTGSDSLYSVAVTGTAIYVGGHQRWLNNPNLLDKPGAGSVPRPGLAAVDPASGLPLAWNPGRNPRGGGAYAMFASADGLYVGSDKNYFGDRKYERDKLGFFPLAGGYIPASTATSALPANIFEAGPTNSTGAGANDLAYRYYAPPSIGAQTVVSGTGITWSNTRGAFLVGSTLFYGLGDGTFHRASFNGTTVGASSVIDPYDDPTWDDVQTGSGQTYRGVASAYYGELNSVTGAFYSDGRLYYSQTNTSRPALALLRAGQRHRRRHRVHRPGRHLLQRGRHVPLRRNAVLRRRPPVVLCTRSRSPTAARTAPTRRSTFATDTVMSGPGLDGRDWRSRSMFLSAPPQVAPVVVS